MGIYTGGPWFDEFLDLSHDWQMRPEWERLGLTYHVSLYTSAEQHTEKAKTLDSAAWQLVQRLRPAPELKD